MGSAAAAAAAVGAAGAVAAAGAVVVPGPRVAAALGLVVAAALGLVAAVAIGPVWPRGAAAALGLAVAEAPGLAAVAVIGRALPPKATAAAVAVQDRPDPHRSLGKREEVVIGPTSVAVAVAREGPNDPAAVVGPNDLTEAVRAVKRRRLRFRAIDLPTDPA